MARWPALRADRGPGLIVGVGTDVTPVERIQSLLERHEEGLRGRVFTAEELEHAATLGYRHQHLAAVFAAKEAVLKALGTGRSNGIAFSDVEIRRLESGKPYPVLHGRAAEVAAQRRNSRFHLSISHDGGVAVAFAIWEADGVSSPEQSTGK